MRPDPSECPHCRAAPAQRVACWHGTPRPAPARIVDVRLVLDREDGTRVYVDGRAVLAVPAPGIPGPEGDLEIAPSVAVGRRIRALRRARGVTLAELARRIGTQHQNVRLEGGAHEPLLSTLVKVARALGVRVAELVNDVDAGPVPGAGTNPTRGALCVDR